MATDSRLRTIDSSPDLAVPVVHTAPRSARLRVGHFVDDVGFDGWARFLPAYRDGMAELPSFAALFDVPTSEYPDRIAERALRF